MNEDPRLYSIAKRITLDAGFPYTDPRTLETTQPRKRKMNKTYKPTWVLYDQIHIDVNIKSDMTIKERKELRSLLNSSSMMSLFSSIIVGPHRDKIKVKVSR